MTRFYLIRHGERELGHDVLVTRTPGISLTENGRRQAQAIAERLQREPIAHIFASPLERTQQTAQPLAATKQLPIEILEGVHEFDFGEWTKRTTTELERNERWRQFNAFRSSTRAPGGELMLEIQARFVRELLALRDRHPNEQIAIFSHGDPLRAAIMYFAGAPMDFWSRFRISIGSITTIVLGPDHVEIVRMNEVPLAQE